jgi:hypothetical protein
MLRGMKIALTPHLSQRGEVEQNPENSCSPRPWGEGLGVRAISYKQGRTLANLFKLCAAKNQLDFVKKYY